MRRLFLFAALLFAVGTAMAQNYKKGNYKGTGGSPHEVVKSANVIVSYGRPYKKGRDIFGGLVPYGKVWRAGADEATEITFAHDCSFGGKKISAGTYTLFITPNKTEWTIILNGQLGQWGAFGYEKVKDKDIAKVTEPVAKPETTIEQFTIIANDSKVIMEWDNTQVSIPITF